jgi:hypothetical protein
MRRECYDVLIFKDRETSGSSGPLVIQRDDRKFSQVRRVVTCGSFQRIRAHVVCLRRNVRGNPKRHPHPRLLFLWTYELSQHHNSQFFAAVWDNGILSYVRNNLALTSIAGGRSLLHLIFQYRCTPTNLQQVGVHRTWIDPFPSRECAKT